MFSIAEKRHIAEVIERTLLELKHPEMPTKRPMFKLHVDGAESWSWADIEPNWKHHDPAQANPWNEVARDIME